MKSHLSQIRPELLLNQTKVSQGREGQALEHLNPIKILFPRKDGSYEARIM